VSASVLLAELERARTFSEHPPSSPLWLHTPPGLRNAYLDGQLEDSEFWAKLHRWLSFTAERE
jgi:hypothetical protein